MPEVPRETGRNAEETLMLAFFLLWLALDIAAFTGMSWYIRRQKRQRMDRALMRVVRRVA